MKSRPRRIRAGIFKLFTAAVASLLAFAGCGTVSLSDPQKIVERAIEAQSELKSVRVELDVNTEIINPNSGSRSATTSYSARGYYENPDKSHFTIQSGSSETEVITIGDKAYVLLPNSSAWVEKSVPEGDGATTPTDVAEYLKNTEELELVDHRGDTYHLRFLLDMAKFAEGGGVPGVDPAVFSGTEAQMEIWVLADSFYVERAQMEFEGDLSSVGVGYFKMSMEADFSEFDEPVAIEAPTP